MRFIYTILLSFFIITGFVQKGNSQSLDLQAVGGIDCNDDLFHLTIQVQSADAASIDLGSFSIYLTFNDEIMTFNAFNSLNFDGSDLCNSGTAAWGTPAYSIKPGVINMNFMLDDAASSTSCPSISNSWTDVVDLVFDVSNFPADADMAFILEHIHFNTNIPNDGTASIPISSTSITINNCLGDYDNDGIGDDVDNCPFTPNPGQEDLNNNLIGDICEASCELTAYTGEDVLICGGEWVTLAASGLGGTPPYDFEWSTGETTDFISVSTNITTPYYITVTDSEGCIDSDTVNIIISDMEILPGLLVLNTDPWSIVDTIYDGDVINFMDLPQYYRLRAQYEGEMESMAMVLSGELEYARRDNSSQYDFLRNTPPTWTADLVPGDYTLSMRAFAEDDTTGLSCANRDVSFTIVSDCYIELGADTSICLGESILLDATSDGQAPFTYAWSTGEDTQTISPSPTEETKYFVTVTDGAGCQIIDFIEVDVDNSGTIGDLVLVDRVTGTPYDIIDGGEVYVVDDFPSTYNIDAIAPDVDGSVEFNLSGPFSIHRYSNVQPHQLIESSDPFILPVGDYTLDVTAYTYNNGTGPSCSQKSVSFTIISCPKVEMDDVLAFCTSVSPNNQEMVNTIVTGNSGPYTYEWSDGSSADHIIINQPISNTTYYLSVTNSNPLCGITEDSIEVYISDANITDISIVDFDDNYSPVRSMRDGDVYNIPELPDSYSFEAYTTGTIGSIRFELTGDLLDPETDNGSPYRYNNDNTPQNLPAGNYTLTTRTHTLANQEGPSCKEIVTSFEVVNCMDEPIAGTEYDVCESHSAEIPVGNTWTDIKDNYGHVIASISDPSNSDLGIVTIDIQRASEVGTISLPSLNEVKVLPRHFHFSASNYPNGGIFANPISVRLYFSEQELISLNSADMGDNGLTNYNGDELTLTHYFGDNQDCVNSNNMIDANNFEEVTVTHQTYTCNGAYLEFPISHFSEFFINEPTVILPIDLISFEGKLINDRTFLNWETAMEENVHGFEIERSFDAESWERIGFVSANNAPSFYNTWDENPAFGINYYRLRTVDFDGSYEYSNIINVIRSNEDKNFIGEISPNPIIGSSFNIPIYLTDNSDIEYQISNSLGQIVSINSQELIKGNHLLNVPTTHYASGMYWLRIIVDHKSYTKKFEVVR